LVVIILEDNMSSVKRQLIWTVLAILGILAILPVCRMAILAILFQIGFRPISGLIDGLHDPNEDVQVLCISYLAQSGPQAIPPLVKILHDGDEWQRRGAAQSLGRMAAVRPAAVPVLQQQALLALVEASKQSDKRLGVRAAVALWQINRQAEQSVPLLITFWKEPDYEVRYPAAICLEEIGPAAKDAIPHLIQSLGEDDPFVRQWAGMALKSIDPAAAAQWGIH
jgi:HEAT repeat protein